VQIHKEGHGVLVRRTTFVSLALLAVWGGMAFYDFLISTFDSMRKLTLSDYRIPVLGQKPDLAAALSWILIAIACWRIFVFLNKAKTVDYLIEADNEFRKVTWPAWRDAVNSALVVLVFIAVVTFLIAVFDFVLTQLLERAL
jgi:preprotein translocase SecE subunit